MKKWIALIMIGLCLSAKAPEYHLKLALVKYNGGGDWYANPSALKNLASFCNQELNTSINPEYATVEVGSPDIFNYPFLHMTGHGNVIINEQEAQNLRSYLFAGGFLHIDDNYGMDKYIRPELKKLFPNKQLEPLPTSHPIFKKPFSFPQGLPKIHEHDQKPPESWVIRDQGRIILLYTFESDLSDGWEDPEVHNDPVEVRLKALQMGANLLQYVLNGQNE
mgnify:FL=1